MSHFPGEILRSRILGDIARSPERRLPLGALLGLCLLAIIGVVCQTIGMCFSAYLSTVQLFLFAFFGYFFIDDYLKRGKEVAAALGRMEALGWAPAPGGYLPVATTLEKIAELEAQAVTRGLNTDEAARLAALKRQVGIK